MHTCVKKEILDEVKEGIWRIAYVGIDKKLKSFKVRKDVYDECLILLKNSKGKAIYKI